MDARFNFLARLSLVLAAMVLLPSCGGGGDDPPLELVVPRDTDVGAALRPQVTLTISNGAGVSGTVVVTLVPEHAPDTVANFLAYVNSGFYDDTVIHRHDEDFVMQGGGFASPVLASEQPTRKATNAPIALELKVSNVQGTVAMARGTGLNTATSEFFINLGDNDFLDFSAGGYAAFGYITDFTLIDAMKLAPCVSSTVTGGNTYGCLPVPNLVVTSAVQTR